MEPYTDVPIDHYDKDGEVRWTDDKRMANRVEDGRAVQRRGLALPRSGALPGITQDQMTNEGDDPMPEQEEPNDDIYDEAA